MLGDVSRGRCDQTLADRDAASPNRRVWRLMYSRCGMKRNLTRSTKLPPFSIDIPKLELFVSQICELFPSGDPRLNFTAYVGSDDLTFDSTEDVKSNAAYLPNRITRFYLSVVGDGRVVRIRVRFTSGAEAEAEGETDVWCAGALALAQRVATDNRTWYSFLRPRYLWIAAILTGTVPPVLQLAGKLELSTAASVAWLIVNLLLWALYFSSPRLLPHAIVVIRSEDNWLREYSTELTLLLSVIALVVSIVTLVV